jgi:hypothetical protein
MKFAFVLLIIFVFLTINGSTLDIQVGPLIYFQVDVANGVNIPHNHEIFVNITNNFKHQFDLKMINLRKVETTSVSAIVNVRSDPIKETTDICQLFSNAIQLPDSFFRCSIPLVHSIRWKLAKYLADLSVKFQTFMHDGEIYSLLYGYEISSSFPLLTPPSPSISVPLKRACIIGVPHPSSLIPILSSSVISEVIILYNSSVFTFNNHDLNHFHYSFSEDLSVIAAFLGKSFQITDQLDYLHDKCHIIQIEPSIIVEDTSFLKNYLHSIMDSSFVKLDYVRVIWLSYLRYQTTTMEGETTSFEEVSHQQNFQDLFHWHLFSVWPVQSGFTLIADSNGFLQKHYSFNDESLDYLAKVSISLYSEKHPVQLDSDEEVDFEISKGRKQLKKKAKKKSDYHILITTVNRVLIDNIFGLQSALNEIGYENTEILSDLTVASYETLLDKYQGDDSHIIQIYLGPSDISLFASNFIAFNTEQKWEPLVFGSTLYRINYIFSLSLSIWCFYHPLTTYLAEKLGYSSTYTIPLYTFERNITDYYHQFYQAINMSSDVTLSPLSSSSEPKEVLFFGSASTRRNEILIYLSNEFIRYNGYNGTDQLSSPLALFRIIVGGWSNLVFDYDRDFYVMKTSLVININNHQESALETHRLNYLLSMKKCVISEKGSDPSLPLLYGDVVTFVNSKEEMFMKSIELLQNDSKRKECEENAFEQFQVLTHDFHQLTITLNDIFF